MTVRPDGVARDLVGFRQQAAFLRHVRDVANQDVAFPEPFDDLLACQSFGYCNGVQHLLAADQRVDHVAQTGVLFEEIFAGLDL